MVHDLAGLHAAIRPCRYLADGNISSLLLDSCDLVAIANDN